MSDLRSPSKSPASVLTTLNEALVPVVCPSGFVTDTLIGPVVALIVSISTWTCVGSRTSHDLAFTPPENVNAMRFANPAPGSKKPDPPLDVPVMVISVLSRWGTTLGCTSTGVAGGGALKL